MLGGTDQALQPLGAAAVRLVRALVERDGRRSLFEAAGEGGGKGGGVGADAHWLLPEIDISLIMREYVEPGSKARALLSKMPWLLPFAKRVDVFRELVAAERRRIKGEALPEHLRGHQVKIRRERILEDGYVQLAGLDAWELKGTIRIEFVSRLGYTEAGIDRHGVFKEFLEETLSRAFDPDGGLFQRTVQGGRGGGLYPSPTSGVADPQHLRLFEFVGKMLGKAFYEGIVLEPTLANFFSAKLLGIRAGVDELPSFDPTLHASIEALKSYDGDVERDLCLSFSAERDELGVCSSVELREGGASIPVTAENRIEYVHLMADFWLNGQIAEPSAAFVSGVHSVVPSGWLRLFSTAELQRLLNGDDLDIDLADLRKHTRYTGGYHDLSPAVRDLWSVLGGFSSSERALFLKFTTSCSKPPLMGFRHLHPEFTVQCVGGTGGETPSVLAFFGMGRKETERLPTASTCFNLLKLPNFKNKKVLREKLLYAIKSASGFELS